MLPESINAIRRYSLALIFAASIALAFIPEETLFSEPVKESKVMPVRTSQAFAYKSKQGFKYDYYLEENKSLGKAEETEVMIIDGNRDLIFIPVHLPCLANDDENIPFQWIQHGKNEKLHTSGYYTTLKKQDLTNFIKNLRNYII